ncbi:MAG: hypothetical protein OXF83_10160 [Anaerolineaceae bacterium]|nr:hypothetical protein [Anaerolineaceae bacterium]MCY4009537.1 hypothetical protein [Anaerolineaceae bacterium]MCY4105679.1 hypothetical protein [Chloroflexota bacterium]
MESGMISQLQKAKRYAEEPERVTLETLSLHFQGDNNEYDLALDRDGWVCSCPGFGMHGLCPHIMSLERLLRPMLKRQPMPYGPHQNVVSDVDKANRYYAEQDRMKIRQFRAKFLGSNSEHIVTYEEGRWDCDSFSFTRLGVSSHTIAMERMLGELVKPQNRGEAVEPED